ncbi:hypothetical protein WA158_003254 [Blastocystis sp. Blastoise]
MYHYTIFSIEMKRSSEPEQTPVSKKALESEEDICRQQLARNYAFFGEDNQKNIENSFVICVGVGGVGSHACYMLARAGVRHIRIIDFDTVSITSLNRHSCATRADIGVNKVDVMKKHILEFMPDCEIEAINSLINQENHTQLLEGNPSFVLDCIDDYQGKLLVIEYCIKNSIPFLSSMGAAAKIDPTRIYIGDISDARGDGLAEKLRFHLKSHGYYQDPPSLSTPFISIPCIYSTEKPVVQMLSLEQSKETKKYDDYNNKGVSKDINTSHLRTRVIPVMGCIPAIFGQSMCAYVLSKIGHIEYTRLTQREKNKNCENTVDYYDVAWLAQQVFHERCVFTNKGITGNRLEMVRWDPLKPIALDNVVLALKSEADKHEQRHSLEEVDPAVRQHVEELLKKATLHERFRHEI